MNNITSFFDKRKRELSNNSNDGQDTKKQREASSLELSFEKASDGDVFKDSLKSEDCILILKRCMENIEEFLNLEKSRSSQGVVHSILKNKTEVKNQSEINNKLYKFYKNLFKENLNTSKDVVFSFL